MDHRVDRDDPAGREPVDLAPRAVGLVHHAAIRQLVVEPRPHGARLLPRAHLAKRARVPRA